MAISQAMCTSFKVQLLNGIHAFSTTVARANTNADSFKLALYTSSASLGATTTAYTTSGEASGTGFRSLADFIFGNNTIDNESEKISMTAPVITEPTSEKIPMTTPILAEEKNNQWLISFVMPKKYTLKTLPRPKNPEVMLTTLPKEKFAVIVFSGLVRESSYDEKVKLLHNFIEKNKLKT